MDWSGVKYTGVDVVQSVIHKNRLAFATPSVRFIHADFLSKDLPTADLLICKDVLQHLPNDKITHFIKQFGKYKYCLITNGVDTQTQSSTNSDIHLGDYRPLDLTRPPFLVTGVKILSYEGNNSNGEHWMKQVLLICNAKCKK